MRLIDADALADALFEKRKNYPQWVSDTIGAMPDAIIRCKDCKKDGTKYCLISNLCEMNGVLKKYCIPSDWFCADGELK